MIAFDSEGFYDDTVSITTLGVERYVRETDHYMCSFASDNEGDWVWVGHPKDAPWEKLHKHEICCHNAAYDLAVLHEYRRRGFIPKEVQWSRAFCTADLVACVGLKDRSLKNASERLLEIPMSKATRNRMKGVKAEDITGDFLEEVQEYARIDAEICLILWQKFGDNWSELQRDASEHTRMMCRRGVHIDLEETIKARDHVLELRTEALHKIPWWDEVTAKGKPTPPLSPKRLKDWCEDEGIPAPVTTNKLDSRYEEWFTENEDKAGWVRALNEYRSANSLYLRLNAMATRCVDGNRLPYSAKFHGCHTGRLSGDEGLNMLNFPRPRTCSKLGIPDVRSLIIPPPGHQLIGADYSQIEGVVLMWLIGDTEGLDSFRSGRDIYELVAERSFGYAGPWPLKKHHPEIRDRAKVSRLGLQYGMWWRTYQKVAKAQAGVILSDGEAEREVVNFRDTNPATVDYWDELKRAFNRCRGGNFTLDLPSGRCLEYYDIVHDDGWRASSTIGGFRGFWNGGKLTENICQAIGYDILQAGVHRLEAAGFPVHLHIYDEVLTSIPLDDPEPEEAVKEVCRILCAEPAEWAAELPLQAEGAIMQSYGKI
jgi:DNA polymerase I-like protein with 3'-5' exonuclease and polymerase domains